jgi:hypothetical protein
MDDHQAWDMESMIMQLLHQLHFEDLEKPISQLSGGQKKTGYGYGDLVAAGSIGLDDLPITWTWRWWNGSRIPATT